MHAKVTQIFGLLTALLGLAMVITTLARGGGLLAKGLLIGVLFVMVGVARLVIARRTNGR